MPDLVLDAVFALRRLMLVRSQWLRHQKPESENQAWSDQESFLHGTLLF
jgi:hypothetical protein